ncbi:MAG: hypothetical protein P8X88_07450 [Gammaproteobacteria bacterium]
MAHQRSLMLHIAIKKGLESELGGLGGRVDTSLLKVVIIGTELTTSYFSLSRLMNLLISEKLLVLSFSIYCSTESVESALIGKITTSNGLYQPCVTIR